MQDRFEALVAYLDVGHDGHCHKPVITGAPRALAVAKPPE